MGMIIAEARARCNALWARAREAARRVPRDALILAVLTLASLASYGLGYLSGRDAGQGSGVSIEVVPPATVAASASAAGGGAATVEGQYVASKNGTKYYLPSCSGASRINEANKVWFATAAAAVAAGYAPAANCPGL